MTSGDSKDQQCLPCAPDDLVWPSCLEQHWAQGKSGGILLTQTCGLPLVTQLSSALKAVAIPSYCASGCHGWSFSSVIVSNSESSITSLDHILQRHGAIIVAVNSPGSLSGCLALQAAIAQPTCHASFSALSRLNPNLGESYTPLPAYFKRIDITGSHAASLARVVESRAHIASIDCVTYALLLQQQPDISRHIRVVARTPSVPCLPYCTSITASDATTDALFLALQAAATDPELEGVRQKLMITGFQRYSQSVSDGAQVDGGGCVKSTAEYEAPADAMPHAECRSPLLCAGFSEMSTSALPLCPYEVAVSRLFLRARGSGSVSVSQSVAIALEA